MVPSLSDHWLPPGEQCRLSHVPIILYATSSPKQATMQPNLWKHGPKEASLVEMLLKYLSQFLKLDKQIPRVTTLSSPNFED